MKVDNSYKYKNSTSKPLTIIIEPWADEFEMNPSEEVIIELEDKSGFSVDVENRGGFLVLCMDSIEPYNRQIR